WALSHAAFTTPCRSCRSTIVCVFSSSPALLPCYCSLAFRHQVRQLTSGVSSKPQSDNRRYKVSCRDAQRSRDGRQSRYRAPCGSDPGVRRSPEQVPCVPPPDRIAGMDMTRNMLDYTAHMSSIVKQNISTGTRRKGKKRYKDAMRRPGGGNSGGALPQTS